jgi:hypothetical protein
VEIPVPSNDFEDGFIVTRGFGKLKVAGANSVFGSQFDILATEKQERGLMDFVSSGPLRRCNVSCPGN